MALFEGIDLSALFDSSSQYGRAHSFGTLTDAQVQRAEETLGYKIPPSYKELLAFRNGGAVSDDLDESWLTLIYGIGPEANTPGGLKIMFENWREEWEYPDIGIPFGETQSGGHDMYYMDCRNVDGSGEPQIVRIDNEAPDNIQIYFVAKNLVEFIRLILANEQIAETRID